MFDDKMFNETINDNEKHTNTVLYIAHKWFGIFTTRPDAYEVYVQHALIQSGVCR